MRLWHKKLIPVLPKQQLLGQWRECCCIARNIAQNGTPNHILVNKILEYPIDHFKTYCDLVFDEMWRRGYQAQYINLSKHFEQISNFDIRSYRPIDESNLFSSWHNFRYFVQCFYNLQEKYDCGGISEAEWNKIQLY